MVCGMKVWLRRLRWCVPAFVLAGVLVRAQTAAPGRIAPADRAGDAAVQALIDRVLDEKAASGYTLSSELAVSSDAERALRSFIAANAKLGPRASTDIAERSASVSVAAVNNQLQQLATESTGVLDGRRLKLATTSPSIEVQGRAAVEGGMSDRPGWRHCSADAVRLAGEAADQDMRIALLLACADFRVSATRSLGELLAEQPDARRALRAAMASLRTTSEYLPSGVCHIRVALPKRDCFALLDRGLRSSAQGIDWVRLAASVPVIVTADGYGVAPPTGQ